jgi:hypothetical protein
LAQPDRAGKSHGEETVINWIDVMIAREMRKDQLARAQKARLLRQIRGVRPPARLRYRLWMAHLGDRLETWGQHLKARYADPPISWPVQPECQWMERDSGRCMC